MYFKAIKLTILYYLKPLFMSSDVIEVNCFKPFKAFPNSLYGTGYTCISCGRGKYVLCTCTHKSLWNLK